MSQTSYNRDALWGKPKTVNIWPELKRKLAEQAKRKEREEAAEQRAGWVATTLAVAPMHPKGRPDLKLGELTKKWRSERAISTSPSKRRLMSAMHKAAVREKRRFAGKQEFRRICQRILKVTGFTMEDILSRNKETGLVRARMAIAYWATRMTWLSMPQIGALMERDHTTILHSCRKYPIVREVLHGRTLKRIK